MTTKKIASGSAFNILAVHLSRDDCFEKGILASVLITPSLKKIYTFHQRGLFGVTYNDTLLIWAQYPTIHPMSRESSGIWKTIAFFDLKKRIRNLIVFDQEMINALIDASKNNPIVNHFSCGFRHYHVSVIFTSHRASCINLNVAF